MKDRNEFAEMDGLYHESDTHEWFHDKINTRYAQTNTGLNDDALDYIVCFVVRDKANGEYDRVVMNSITNQPVYDSKSMEDVCAYIDKLKIVKRFKNV